MSNSRFVQKKYQIEEEIERLKKSGIDLLTLAETIFNNDGLMTVLWSVEDIKAQAESMDIELSEEEAEEVLKTAIDNHDANVGINWEVIGTQIQISFPEKF